MSQILREYLVRDLIPIVGEYMNDYSEMIQRHDENNLSEHIKISYPFFKCDSPEINCYLYRTYIFLLGEYHYVLGDGICKWKRGDAKWTNVLNTRVYQSVVLDDSIYFKIKHGRDVVTRIMKIDNNHEPVTIFEREDGMVHMFDNGIIAVADDVDIKFYNIKSELVATHPQRWTSFDNRGFGSGGKFYTFNEHNNIVEDDDDDVPSLFQISWLTKVEF